MLVNIETFCNMELIDEFKAFFGIMKINSYDKDYVLPGPICIDLSKTKK